MPVHVPCTSSCGASGPETERQDIQYLAMLPLAEPSHYTGPGGTLVDVAWANMRCSMP